jgi:hypothetical protein
MTDVMGAYLKRIRWEGEEAPVLFPFPTAGVVDGRKSVSAASLAPKGNARD